MSLRFSSFLPPLLAVFAPAAFLSAQTTAAASVRLHHLHLISVTTDKAEFTADCTLLPALSARLEGLSFRGILLDRWLPVFIDPSNAALTLTKDQALPIPALHLTVYLADVPSMEKLRQMLGESSVSLEGEVRAHLRLSLPGRLGLANLHPVALFLLNQPVDVDVGAEEQVVVGGVGLLAIAGEAAHIAQQVLPVQVKPVEDPRLRSAAVRVQTRYAITSGSQSKVMQVVRMGIWIAPRLLLVPDEVLEPWAFAPGVAIRLAHGGAHLDRASVEITAGPLDSPDDALPWSLTRGDLQILRRGKPQDERLVVSPDGEQIKLLRRDSPGNFALLVVKSYPTSLALTPASDLQSDDTVELLYRRPDGHTQDLKLTADPGIELSRPVSPGSFGSPVLTGQGVAGMVQSETSTLPVRGVVTPEDMQRVTNQ